MKPDKIFLYFLLIGASLQAQQLPLFTQYREYSGIINPAYVNSDFFLQDYDLSFGASFRAQWVGQPETPRTMLLRGEYVMADSRSVNGLVGGYLMNDQVGPTGFTGIYGRIGGILSQDPRDGGLVLAISAGAVQHRIKASEVVFIQPNDPAQQNQSRIIPDVGAGVFYYQRLGDNSLYAGISVPQVIGFDLTYKDQNGEFQLNRKNHFYAQAGYYWYVNDESFLEPSVWVRYLPSAPLSMDINLRFQLNGSFWIGGGGGTNGSFHAETGVLLGDNLGFDNTIKIGYGFDYFFNTFGPFFGSSHELNVAYLLAN